MKDYEVWGFVTSLGLGFEDLFSDIKTKLDSDNWYFLKSIVIFIYDWYRGDENRGISQKS